MQIKDDALPEAESPLLKPGYNCWRTSRARQASMVVDCANYYRALHQAICNAKHSIFVLGWDIDSRIELLRGKDAAQANCPVNFFELIQWKARQNPEIMIYLNRWQFSLLFASQREGLSTLKWRFHSPVNVHYCFDSLLPISACHHQKVIVIDDEIVFCGGMDVAIARWDHREHYPEDDNRADPGGMTAFIRKVPFGPYHDIMCLLSGQPAQDLAQWCRERWRRAAGFEPVPLRPLQFDGLPPSWPSRQEVDFENIEIGIAMTIPPVNDDKAVQHIEQLYLDMIARAENFIYIENQYLTSQIIAMALNERLRKIPNLRVLIASCFESNGTIERKSMWTGRVRFRETLESGNVADRVTIAYPISGDPGQERDVRIHSKVMIIDDKYLRVGSSNLNNRSMGLDTECDIVMIGDDEKSRRKIAKIRNDLINEHTGRGMEAIEKLVSREVEISAFLNYIGHSTQHFRKVNDEHFRFEKFSGFCTRYGDPEKPFIPPQWTMTYRYAPTRRNLPRRLLLCGALAVILALLCFAWQWPPLEEAFSPDRILSALAGFKNSPYAFWIFLCAFAVSGIVVPVTLLIILSVAVWGLAAALPVALAGIMLTSILGFGLGRAMGLRPVRALLGTDTEKYRQFVENTGFMGITLFRMIPIAPFSLVNIGLAVVGLPFLRYMCGTLVGMLPRLVTTTLVGHSLIQLWLQPGSGTLLHYLGSVTLWFAVMIATHFWVRRWQKKTYVKGYV